MATTALTIDESKLAELNKHLATVRTNVAQLLKGKKVSAQRARAALLGMSKVASDLRKDVLAYSKALPTKKRGAPKAKQPEPEVKQPDPEELAV